MARRTTADSPDLVLAETLEAYERVLESRTPSVSPVRVLNLRAEDDFDAVAAGSVVAYFARKGSAVLAALAAAVEQGDLAAIEKIHERQEKAALGRKERDSKPRSLDAVPRYAELRYGGKTISRAVYLTTPAAVEARTYAYNGGKLDSKQFKAVQYARGGKGVELEVLVVKRAPKLSRLEKEILAKAPAAESEANISADMAFLGKIVRAIVEGGKRLVKAVTKLGRTGGPGGCPRNFKAVMTMQTILPRVMLVTEGACKKMADWHGDSSSPISKNASASDLLTLRRAELIKNLTDGGQGS